MELQKCSRCGSEKLLETYFSKNVKGLYNKTCDVCRASSKIKCKIYREANKAKIQNRQKADYEKNREKVQQRTRDYHHKNKEERNTKSKEYYEKNREKVQQRTRDYHHENKEERNTKSKEYYEKNREAKQKYRETNKDHISNYRREYIKDKRHYCNHDTIKRICKICSPKSYLKSLISASVHQALQAHKSKKSIEYLGCDISEFRKHLQQSFKDGMTWENQGEWEIDHIIPVAYKQDGIEPSIEEVAKRLHYLNCQAMWRIENIKKGNRYCGDYHSD
jgi:hypothetical protein